MSYTILQNTPTVIDLVSFAKTRGWTLGSGYAEHEACNFGSIEVMPTTFTPVTGQSYTVSYKVSNYVSGNIVLRIGTNSGITRTGNNNYTETIVATGVNPKVLFYSTGDLRLNVIDIVPAAVNVLTKKKNTIVFSEVDGKWTTFLSFTSDYGLSLFKDLFTFKKGKMYRHDPELPTRNNIYGVQYKTIFKFVANAGDGIPKTFAGLSYEGNQLMVTTGGGIMTSLGQISELIELDFLKYTLESGVTRIDIYSVEGVFSSSFLRDMSNGGDINNGDVLKGSHIVVELVQVDDVVLRLSNIKVHSEYSPIGSR